MDSFRNMCPSVYKSIDAGGSTGGNSSGVSNITIGDLLDFLNFIIENGKNKDVDMVDTQPGDPATFWFFDDKGQELLNHWLGGSAKNLNFEYDKSWSDYMSKNKLILERLQRIARSRSYFMNSEGKTKTSESSGNFSFEIDDGYNTGYKMLHGTRYFSYKMNGRYDKSSDSYIFNFDLRWKDQIDHNSNIFFDRVFNNVARAVGHPADYWIIIKWTQTITVKNGEWVRLY